MTIYDGKLLVGEFHREGNYERDESHEVTTPSGSNKAVTFAYEINNESEYGIASTIPTYAISTTSLVQGMVVTNGNIILSTSYSLPSSHLYVYKNILSSAPTTQIHFDSLDDVAGEDFMIDTYILDTPTSSQILPQMSEEITIKDGSLYILFENACSKYKMFTRLNLTDVYSLELSNLLNIEN